MRVGGLICNYNSWKLARRCLEAVRSVEPHLGVTVVDDGSSSAERPESDGDGYRLIRHGKRRGFPVALNSGIAAVDAEIVVNFDADAYPLVPFVDVVTRRFREDERLGILGFRCVDGQGRETPSLAGPPELLPFVLGQSISSLVQRLGSRSGRRGPLLPTLAGLAVRRAAFEDVGGFDEALGFLDVDVDFGLRLLERGWKVAQDSSLRVFHVGGGSELGSGERLEQFYRDRWQSLSKHRGVRWPRLLKGFVRTRLGLEYLTLKALLRLRFRTSERIRWAAEGRRLARRALRSARGTSGGAACPE